MTNDPAVGRRPLSARWAWLLVLLAGVAAYLIVLRTLVVTQNPLYVPSLLLLGSAVVPVSVLVYAASGPRRAPVGAGLIAAVAGVGGVIGTVAAGTLEYDTLQRLGTVPMIMVGLIEESAKLVVPVIILIFARRRDPAAGRRERGVARALGRFRSLAGPDGRGHDQLRRSAVRGASLAHGRAAVAGAADPLTPTAAA